MDPAAKFSTLVIFQNPLGENFEVTRGNSEQKKTSYVELFEKIKINFEAPHGSLKVGHCISYFIDIYNIIRFIPAVEKVQALSTVKEIFGMTIKNRGFQDINLASIVLKVFRKFKSEDKEVDSWAVNAFLENFNKENVDGQNHFPSKRGFRATTFQANEQIISAIVEKSILDFSKIQTTSLVDLLIIFSKSKREDDPFCKLKCNLINYCCQNFHRFPLDDILYFLNKANLQNPTLLPLLEKFSDEKFTLKLVRKIDFPELDDKQLNDLLKRQKIFLRWETEIVDGIEKKIKEDIKKQHCLKDCKLLENYIDEYFISKDLSILVGLMIAFSRVCIKAVVPKYMLRSVAKTILIKAQQTESTKLLLNLLSEASFEWYTVKTSGVKSQEKLLMEGEQFLFDIAEIMFSKQLDTQQRIQAFYRFATLRLWPPALLIDEMLDLVSSMEIWDKIEIYDGLTLLGIEVKENFCSFLAQIEEKEWQKIYTKDLVRVFLIAATLFDSQTCPDEIKKIAPLLNERLQKKPTDIRNSVSKLFDCYHILGLGTAELPKLHKERSSKPSFLQTEITKKLEAMLKQDVNLKNLKVIAEKETICGRNIDIVIEGEKLGNGIAVEIDGPTHFTRKEKKETRGFIIRNKLHNLSGYSEIWSFPTGSIGDVQSRIMSIADLIIEKLRRHLNVPSKKPWHKS